MSSRFLNARKVLITQADQFMGPAIHACLSHHGAEVIADCALPADPQTVGQLVENAGAIDALVINLAIPAPSTLAVEATDTEWRAVFAALVDPLPWLIRAAVPGMIARNTGRIVVIGSASALRGMKRASTYSAARGAQISYVQALGVELAPRNIQVNAIAQHFVENETYFPDAVTELPRFRERIKRDVPLGRLVSAREDAEFVAYLLSDAARCFVGQVFPVCGGWVVR